MAEASSHTEDTLAGQHFAIPVDASAPILSEVSPCEFPEGDESLPFGKLLVTDNGRHNTLSGSLVDVFDLFNRETEDKTFERLEEKQKEKIRRHKMEWCWTNWLSAFLIYVSTIVRAHPEKAYGLVQYLDMIHQAHMDFAGSLQYDEGFRMRMACHPTMHCTGHYGCRLCPYHTLL
ncbi:hypothetical protein JRQ81_013663 [Phrynocephalus forsythii]|uniref:Uncharacterized protein n=1 Tax=Phrynocephalus forsythii TaxID=171643 RepID=A0A9Q0Y0A9_9SAUR|nr:hypothetical protein JRQ81_013663 [Phrynocephalus forsythii]